MKKTSSTIAIHARWMTLLLLCFMVSSNLSAQLACNNLINASVSPTINVCETEINSDMILEGTYPPIDYFIEIHDGVSPVVSGTNVVVISSSSLYFGKTLTATVTDVASGVSCWGSLTVEDKLAPSVACQNVSVGCADDLDDVVPFPTATDNCDLNPDIQLTNEVINTSTQCNPGFVTITRTYIAVDNQGNTSASCDQVITINRPNEIDFPNDIIWTCDQYNAFSNITDASKLHEFITDTDPTSALVIDVNLDETCDDNDFDPNPDCSFLNLVDDNPAINNTNIANGGLGCFGASNCATATDGGLDDADVLELTGSGIPEDVDGVYCLYQYSNADALLTSCGSTFKIIRTWTVLDWCTGQVVTGNSSGEDNIQVIKVMDKVAPTIAPMADIEVNANNPGAHPSPCTSTGLVPSPDVSDNCNSTTFKIFTSIGEVVYVNGGGLIPSPGLPQGWHEVTYQATDACGNVTELKVPLHVVDNMAPAAICDEITDVNLSSDGFAHVPSTVFDDGSFDNCCLDRFEVRRMEVGCGVGTDFAPAVTFCCADITANPVQVVFRVVDCDGNTNECMVDVNVQDKLPPILVNCPSQQTITCDYYWDNIEVPLSLGDNSVLDQFGVATFIDNCNLNITPNINVNLDQCGDGSITRTWQASDDSGNGPTTCTQLIFVNHVSDWVVEFPADLTATCTEDEPEFGEPELFFETCELIAVSYDDTYYNVVPDACYKIARTWTVINWCVVGDNVDQEVVEVPESQMPFAYRDLDGDGINFEPRVFRDSWNGNAFPSAGDAGVDGAPDTDLDQDPWDGYIEYEQIIKVIDNVAPTFPNGCAIDDVCIDGNTCSAQVTIPTPDVQDCSEDVTVTYTHDLGNLNTVAPGTYTVTYTAMDNCGNSNACQTTVTVEDCKKPTPYCKNGLVIELMQTGEIDIWSSDFDAGSFDNCPGTLSISFSTDVSDTQRIFNCDQVGQQNVEIWVTDAAGNQDFCNTFVIVEDNMNACDDPLVVNVGGAIATEEDMSVNDVTVELSGQSSGMVTTDINGMYNFTSVPVGNDVTITPVKDVNPLNGVTTYDLVLITKHILAVNKLDSPYKIIAADANKTGTVTTSDLVQLRKLILHIDDNFSNNTSWRFVDADFEFPNEENPFETSFPEVVNINNVPSNILNAEFVAIKVGDVNGSASFTSVDDRSGDTFILNTNDISVKAGELYTVDFKATDMSIEGYQFTMNFNQNVLNFVDMVPAIAQKENFGFTLLEEGAITSSWNGNASAGTVFSLTFTAKEDGQLSDLLNVNSRYTTAEAYNNSGEVMDVELTFNGQSATAFDLYQNTPNPFKGETVIGFNLPEAGTATLTIQDVSGKVISVVEGDFAKGYNQVSVNSNNMPNTGVLYYTLASANDTATRKMIILQ